MLFLAPISCFDEHLAEDRRVNRLKDSFILWKSIVGSKLLANSVIICACLHSTKRLTFDIDINCQSISVFLNKCDLLEKKLKAGAKVKKYIPRYGDRENKATVFGKCT